MNFTDEFGRTLPVVPIIGPNTTGKTSILDAISLCLMPVTEIYYLPSVDLNPAAIVRRGAVQAKVSRTVRFSAEELQSIREITGIANTTYKDRIPDVNSVTAHWEYPDRNGKHHTGNYRCAPENGWSLFKGRILTKRNLYQEAVTPDDFVKHGGVFQFDQQRRGLTKRISRINKDLLSVGLDDGQTSNGKNESEFTTAPKSFSFHLPHARMRPNTRMLQRRRTLKHCVSFTNRLVVPIQSRGATTPCKDWTLNLTARREFTISQG